MSNAAIDAVEATVTAELPQQLFRLLISDGTVVLAGRSEEHGRAAEADLAPLGPASYLAVDVKDEAAVEALFRGTLPLLGGRLDILYHVAGVSGRRFGDGPLHDCTAAGWDVCLDTLDARLSGRDFTQPTGWHDAMASYVD